MVRIAAHQTGKDGAGKKQKKDMRFDPIACLFCFM